MTKAELIKRLTVHAGGQLTRKESERFADAVFDLIAEAVLNKGRFTYPGFGTWSLASHRERRAHNPRTHAPMQLPPRRTVRFRTAQTLLEAARTASGGRKKPGPAMGV
jgi:DNA-binding protein HU-beta